MCFAARPDSRERSGASGMVYTGSGFVLGETTCVPVPRHYPIERSLQRDSTSRCARHCSPAAIDPLADRLMPRQRLDFQRRLDRRSHDFFLLFRLGIRGAKSATAECD